MTNSKRFLYSIITVSVFIVSLAGVKVTPPENIATLNNEIDLLKNKILSQAKNLNLAKQNIKLAIEIADTFYSNNFIPSRNNIGMTPDLTGMAKKINGQKFQLNKILTFQGQGLSCVQINNKLTSILKSAKGGPRVG